MSRLDMQDKEVFYPKMDEKRIKRIKPSPEILSQYGTQYFFSPGFKMSDIVIANVLRRYYDKEHSFVGKLKNVVNKTEGMYTQFEIEKNKQLNRKVQGVINTLSKGIRMKDVLAYFEDTLGTDNSYILTKEQLFSDYRDDKGEYINYYLSEIILSDTGIYNLNGIRIVKGTSFSRGFINLFREIKSLGQEVELTNYRHPLRKEPLEVRKKYLEILIDKCFYNGYLSANEVIRLEILARQLGISSQIVIEKMQESKKAQIKDEQNYLSWVIKKVNDIPEQYYYVLFHDIVTFELFISNNELKENVSAFTEAIIRKCELNQEFTSNYLKIIQKFIKSSYEIRNIMENTKYKFQSADIVNNIFESIEFEYHMQKEMLRR